MFVCMQEWVSDVHPAAPAGVSVLVTHCTRCMMGNTRWLTRPVFLICPADSSSPSHPLFPSLPLSAIPLTAAALLSNDTADWTSHQSDQLNVKLVNILHFIISLNNNFKKGPTCFVLSFYRFVVVELVNTHRAGW